MTYNLAPSAAAKNYSERRREAYESMLKDFKQIHNDIIMAQSDNAKSDVTVATGLNSQKMVGESGAGPHNALNKLIGPPSGDLGKVIEEEKTSRLQSRSPQVDQLGAAGTGSEDYEWN